MRLMNEMASASGLKLLSEGMSFRQGFGEKYSDNVKAFVDEVINNM